MSTLIFKYIVFAILRLFLNIEFKWIFYARLDTEFGQIPWILSLARYHVLGVYVGLFAFLFAPVSDQQIWPDTKFD